MAETCSFPQAMPQCCCTQVTLLWPCGSDILLEPLLFRRCQSKDGQVVRCKEEKAVGHLSDFATRQLSQDKSCSMIVWPLHHLWNYSLCPRGGQGCSLCCHGSLGNAASAWPPGISAALAAAVWDLGTGARQSQTALQNLIYHPKAPAPASNLAPFLEWSAAGDMGHTPFAPSPCPFAALRILSIWKCWLPTELAGLLAATESKYHCALLTISAHHEDAWNPSLSQV